MIISGHVYRTNGSPLKGIRVSDGRNVCLTDDNGCFSLDTWEKASNIYCNILTYNLHDWYLPLKGHNGNYDFHLNPCEDREHYRFLHLSDTEIKKGGCESYLPWVRNEIRKHDAAFILHGGDICYEEGMVCHREEMNESTVGCPVRYSIGNHDFLDGDYGEQRYEELYGPIWYSFDLGRIHYVVFAIPKGSGFASGYSIADQYRWLKNDMKFVHDKKIVIFRHDHFTEGECFCAEIENEKFDLVKMGLIAWIQGHAHTNFLIENNSVLHMCSSRPDCGGIDNTAGSMRMVEINEGSLTSKVLFHTVPFASESVSLWLTTIGGNIEYTDLLESEGHLYIANADDGFPRTCGVFSLSAENGKIEWFTPTKNSIKSDLAVDSEFVYASDSEGFVYAITRKNGKIQWETKIPCSARIRGNVLLNGDILYVGTGQMPVFLKKTDGSMLFVGAKERKGGGTPAKTVLSEDKNLVFYSAQWLKLIALDAVSGEIKWDHRTQKGVISNHGAFWYRTNTPCVKDGKLYAFGYGYGAIVDLKTGEILLHKPVKVKTEVVGKGLIDGDLLYLPTGKQGVTVFDRNTLEQLWTYPVGDSVIFTSSYVAGPHKTVESSPVLFGDEIMFAANDGYVYFYDKKSPELRKIIKLAYPTLTTPLIRNGHLYAASFDGTVGKYPIDL